MLNRTIYISLILAFMQIPLAGAMPAEVMFGSITYLSGGIGLDEATEMKSMASRYALEVVSVIKAGTRDQYTADYRVSIRDKAGKIVLDAMSEGPFFMANLPDGGYQIEVSQNGKSKQQRVLIKRGTHKRLVFVWPQ